jgi:hypothetical protein
MAPRVSWAALVELTWLMEDTVGKSSSEGGERCNDDIPDNPGNSWVSSIRGSAVTSHDPRRHRASAGADARQAEQGGPARVRAPPQGLATGPEAESQGRGLLVESFRDGEVLPCHRFDAARARRRGAQPAAPSSSRAARAPEQKLSGTPTPPR